MYKVNSTLSHSLRHGDGQWKVALESAWKDLTAVKLVHFSEPLFSPGNKSTLRWKSPEAFCPVLQTNCSHICTSFYAAREHMFLCASLLHIDPIAIESRSPRVNRILRRLISLGDAAAPPWTKERRLTFASAAGIWLQIPVWQPQRILLHGEGRSANANFVCTLTSVGSRHCSEGETNPYHSEKHKKPMGRSISGFGPYFWRSQR